MNWSRFLRSCVQTRRENVAQSLRPAESFGCGAPSLHSNLILSLAKQAAHATRTASGTLCVTFFEFEHSFLVTPIYLFNNNSCRIRYPAGHGHQPFLFAAVYHL